MTKLLHFVVNGATNIRLYRQQHYSTPFSLTKIFPDRVNRLDLVS